MSDPSAPSALGRATSSPGTAITARQTANRSVDWARESALENVHRIQIALSSTEDLLKLARARHDILTSLRAAASRRAALSSKEITYVGQLALTLLAIHDLIDDDIRTAPLDAQGLPLLRAGLTQPRSTLGLWRADDPLAGRIEAIHPFQHVDLWRELVRRTSRKPRPSRRAAPPARGCDPPESCGDAVPSLAPKVVVPDEPRPGGPKRAVPGGVTMRIPATKRKLEKVPATVRSAVRLMKLVKMKDLYAAHGYEPPPEIDGARLLRDYAEGISYVGAGYVVYFTVQGALRQSPVGEMAEIEAATNSPAGVYFNLPPGRNQQIASVRLDRGLVEESRSAAAALSLTSAERRTFTKWRRSAASRYKSHIVVFSRSYWHRSGRLTAIGRGKKLAAEAMVALPRLLGAQAKKISLFDVASTVLASVFKKLPGIDLIFFKDNVEAAARMGRAVGFACWGTTDEDIRISAEMVAREIADEIIGKAMGKAVGKAGKAAAALKGRVGGGGGGGAPSTSSPSAPETPSVRSGAGEAPPTPGPGPNRLDSGSRATVSGEAVSGEAVSGEAVSGELIRAPGGTPASRGTVDTGVPPKAPTAARSTAQTSASSPAHRATNPPPTPSPKTARPVPAPEAREIRPGVKRRPGQERTSPNRSARRAMSSETTSARLTPEQRTRLDSIERDLRDAGLEIEDVTHGHRIDEVVQVHSGDVDDALTTVQRLANRGLIEQQSAQLSGAEPGSLSGKPTGRGVRLDPPVKSSIKLAHDAGVEGGERQARRDGIEVEEWTNPKGFIGEYGRGFDGVGTNAATQRPVVLEYKGGGAKLATGQMSDEWIGRKLAQLHVEGDPMAGRLFNSAMRNELTGRVYTTSVGDRGVLTTRLTKEFGYDAKRVRVAYKAERRKQLRKAGKRKRRR